MACPAEKCIKQYSNSTVILAVTNKLSFSSKNLVLYVNNTIRLRKSSRIIAGIALAIIFKDWLIMFNLLIII